MPTIQEYQKATSNTYQKCDTDAKYIWPNKIPGAKQSKLPTSQLTAVQNNPNKHQYRYSNTQPPAKTSLLRKSMYSTEPVQVQHVNQQYTRLRSTSTNHVITTTRHAS